MVLFYRTALKQKGDELFEAPPTHQFEIGRFRDETMAFPPSVTIKDYTWGGSAGYPNPKRGGSRSAFRPSFRLSPRRRVPPVSEHPIVIQRQPDQHVRLRELRWPAFVDRRLRDEERERGASRILGTVRDVHEDPGYVLQLRGARHRQRLLA